MQAASSGIHGLGREHPLAVCQSVKRKLYSTSYFASLFATPSTRETMSCGAFFVSCLGFASIRASVFRFPHLPVAPTHCQGERSCAGLGFRVDGLGRDPFISDAK